jgi:hypothetical protein
MLRIAAEAQGWATHMNRWTRAEHMWRAPVGLIRISLSLFLTVLMWTTHFALAQDALGPLPKKPRTLEDYTASTLKEIAAPYSGRNGTRTTGNIQAFKVRAIYAGVTRMTSKSSMNALLRWTQCCAGDPDHYLKSYDTEMLFRENGVEYWLPIQRQLLANLHTQFISGDSVNLYLIRVATEPDGGDRNWALLVENFTDPDEERNKARRETLGWIRDNLQSFSGQNLSVETPEICQLRIAEAGNRSGSLRVVRFLLAQLDDSSVEVSRAANGALSEVLLQTKSGKRSISFVIYDGNPAEAGQTNRYSLTFRERQKAEEMAQAFQRAIKLCSPEFHANQ